jgi:hypothetical protein
MKTPEGQVKDKVKEFLHLRKVQSLTHPIPDAVGFYWMPVTSGYGAPFLDFMIIYKGKFFGLETKRDRMVEPTARQKIIISMIGQAGGRACWGADDAVEYLNDTFNFIDQHND